MHDLFTPLDIAVQNPVAPEGIDAPDKDRSCTKFQDVVVLSLGMVRTDGGTQPRCRMSQQTIDDYAELLMEGTELPPVHVFRDGESDWYWLADGFHRHAAHLKAGRDVIRALVHPGTQRDAILFSVGANSEHGLQRTKEDKQRAVKLLLFDAEWGNWVDREIARQCHVSDRTVNRIRASLTPTATETQRDGDGNGNEAHGQSHQAASAEEPERKYKRNGVVHTMKTGAIGKKQKRKKVEPVEAAQVAPVDLDNDQSPAEGMIEGPFPTPPFERSLNGQLDSAIWLRQTACELDRLVCMMREARDGTAVDRPEAAERLLVVMRASLDRLSCATNSAV